MAKEREEIEKLKEKLKKVKNINPSLKGTRTFGQRTADSLTKWAGSWVFIIGFLVFLIIWIFINVNALLVTSSDKVWDPYPFILLNLLLSCLAAIQAPVILMSQNRAAEKDRQRAEYDYAVNRKSEREIREIKKLILNMKKKL